MIVSSKRGEDNILPEDRLTVDPVTGLRNEHLFRLRLRDEFYQARERETNAALLAVKLDGIVDINARYGRSGGDDALRALGNLLRKIQSAPLNAAHLLFKLSGPVFGYYLPACSSEEAQSLAHCILKETSQSELFIERITVSIGTVNLYEFFTREEDLGQITQAVERAALRRMTAAERRGGNTVCAVSEIQDAATEDKSTVLIVDPDQSAAEPLVRALRTADVEVEYCRNGETAFTLIQAKPPAVVICEAMTPRLNGFMLRDRLRSNAVLGVIPFILVSHKKTEEFINQAVALDIRHYFRKPFSISEVTGLVRNLLRSKTA
jgi:two-component system cell cycle response regulator